MIKSRVGNILVKAAALRINLNIDGVSIESKSHTHPSHSQTSRLLLSSHRSSYLSLVFDSQNDETNTFLMCKFVFTTVEKKILENCRCIVPNFMNYQFI